MLNGLEVPKNIQLNISNELLYVKCGLHEDPAGPIKGGFASTCFFQQTLPGTYREDWEESWASYPTLVLAGEAEK